jgi:outer membrane immunogenic protein
MRQLNWSWRILMRILWISLLAAVAGGLSSPALASDPYGPADNSGYGGSGQDFSGFYAGVIGTGVLTSPDGLVGLGAVAGFNAEFEYVLVGTEVTIQALRDSGTSNIELQSQLIGRAGVVMDDDLLIYGAGGIGFSLTGPSESFGLIGAGMEFAFSEGLSFRGQYVYGNELSGGTDQHQVSLGALVHF